MNRALEFSLLLTVPGAFALMVIPAPIVGVLFERGAFGAGETAATAGALAAYAIGLPAYVLIKVLGPGYFAREDTTTPVKIAACCVGINLVLNLILMGPLLHVGVALATAIAAWVNAALMFVLLLRRGHFAVDDRLRRAAPRIVAASIGMAVVLLLVRTALADFAATGNGQAIAVLVVLIAVGMATFAALVIATGAARLADIRRMLDRSKR